MNESKSRNPYRIKIALRKNLHFTKLQRDFDWGNYHLHCPLNKTAFRKTPKHAGDDDQKQHTHDGNPDMEQGEKDPKTDQVLRDESGDCNVRLVDDVLFPVLMNFLESTSAFLYRYFIVNFGYFCPTYG
ncbi:hypothetical protein EGR_00299 [Echinococcus granulosus]|uniref:Uncharacterized protein n=1 Tax=Echinococcus granulosus TaxID=6210 RepID=W6UTS8_ECHGR|nr:hypothetical protein EGR_00299 [Echinococcus granulosus]EUB65030.1 hypothetical protein EGR_00299 [Echinococcus granulosus]